MKFHNLFENKFDSWKNLEKAITDLETKQERGKAFEDLIYFYFKYKSKYYQISEIYQEEDIPEKYRDVLELESTDYGVDGLIVRNNGDLVTYQVKFKSDRSSPSYRELSTFWTESEYADHRYTVANSYSLPSTASKKKRHSSILVDTFESLDEDFFKALQAFAQSSKIPQKEKYTPRPYQEDIISDLVHGLKENDRGKLIAACGTGKTLISLWTLERLGSESVLFVVPSLALIKQTLKEWTEQADEPFNYICVCSDESVVKDSEDRWDISINEMDVPVTTDASEVSEFLNNDFQKRGIVFSTYQSLDVVSEAIKETRGFEFDLSIFDEAHRTAGSSNSGLFSLGLKDSKIRSRKRLFMTATERLVKPRTKKLAESKDIEVFSMDDKNIYGKTLSEFPFGEAIKSDVISDYKIVVAGVTNSQINEYIEKDLYLKARENEKDIEATSNQIAKQVLLVKSFENFSISKVFSFHSTLDSAKRVAFGGSKNEFSVNDLFLKSDIDDDKEIYVDHINGSMSAGKRRRKFDDFERSDIGIITNARALTEGVDVPKVDSIFFSDPKGSLIDIIQATGRALRKKQEDGKNTAYIVIPVFVPDDMDESEIIENSNFETVFNIIQAMRDQDERLDSWINEINLKYGKGKKLSSESVGERVEITMPEKIDLDQFRKNLKTRIIEVNPEPEESKYKRKEYGKGDRKSEFERKMKTIGDYTTNSFKENLVDPTIKKFDSPNEGLPYEELKVDHNNVSHTRRLGLIKESEDGNYVLTSLGKDYYNNDKKFNDLFKIQMLKYFDFYEENMRSLIFPYRNALEVLLEVGYVKKPEFIYGIYTIENTTEKSIKQSVNRIQYIRENYPNLSKLNKENKENVLKKLNKKFGLSFSYDDVWSNKTTIYNQFLYFRDHLSIFESITSGTKKISLKEGNKDKIRRKLSETSGVLNLNEKDYNEAKGYLDEQYISKLGYSII